MVTPNSQLLADTQGRLAHFDIAIHHFAGSNLKFTDFLSRNPVKDATTEDVYDEQYVINILSEQVELNMKYGSITKRT